MEERGHSSDQAQKRLGDGLYEQRLIEQAITARTGKRFLDGLTSNDAQFRYLMDNGLASKEALNLSVGISLTAYAERISNTGLIQTDGWTCWPRTAFITSVAA